MFDVCAQQELGALAREDLESIREGGQDLLKALGDPRRPWGGAWDLGPGGQGSSMSPPQRGERHRKLSPGWAGGLSHRPQAPPPGQALGASGSRGV